MGTGNISNIKEALSALGVSEHTLTIEEKQALDEQGFVLFRDIIDVKWLEQLRHQYELLMKKEGQSAGLEVHQETGTRRLADLVNKGEVFDPVYIHPKILAAVYHVLQREFKLSSLNARDAIPGQGHQALHADWGTRQQNEPFHVVNSIWLLDDFTPENGSTRVVPGSHRLGGGPADHMIDPADTHPKQIQIIAPAGSVGVFNSHLWHGGTMNHTEQTRRALHGYYTAREHEQQFNQQEYIRKRTYDRLSPAARYILNV